MTWPVLSAEEIMEHWAPGSYGPEWTWGDEEAELNARGELDVLADQVCVNGFTEPVLLGDDGRVWDGHHRILVGHMMAIPVPFTLGTTVPGWTHGHREFVEEDILDK